MLSNFGFPFQVWVVSPEAAMVLGGAVTMFVSLASFVLAIRTRLAGQMSRYQLEQLLHVRDVSIRTSLLARLPKDRWPELKAMIDDAFREGDRIWATEHLVTMLGPKDAHLVLTNDVTGHPRKATP